MEREESSIICEASLVQQVEMVLQRIKLTQINESRITYASSIVIHSKWQPKSSVELWKLPKVEWKCRKVVELLSSLLLAGVLLWWRHNPLPWFPPNLFCCLNLFTRRITVQHSIKYLILSVCLLSIAKFEDKQRIRFMHRFFPLSFFAEKLKTCTKFKLPIEFPSANFFFLPHSTVFFH
jgi:hypothetical protein